MRSANLATIGVFVLFLLAPVGSLAIWGYDTMAARQWAWDEVNWGKLVSASDDYRTALVREVLIETPAGIAAIRARSAFDYDIVGYVRTESVASGLDDWLFFRPSLELRTCQDEGRLVQMLDQVEAMRAVASAADIDLRFSVSPDKELVHPEKLGPDLAEMSKCALQGAALWRRLARDKGSSVIDHLAAFDRRATAEPLYHRTDTHWNWLGRAAALRQLAQLYRHVDPGAPGSPSGKEYTRADLLRMLRLDRVEAIDSYESWLKSFAAAVSPGVPDALIVHDSFYEAFDSAGPMLFPDGSFIALKAPEVEPAMAAAPRHVLANSVERDFLPRLSHNEYSWRSAFGRGLLEANRRAAAGCALRSVQPRRAAASRVSFSVDLPASDGKPCLTLSFDTGSQSPLRVLLPTGASGKAGDPSYRTGFSIESGGGAHRSLAVVLPKSMAGRSVRWELADGSDDISEASVFTGTVPP